MNAQDARYFAQTVIRLTRADVAGRDATEDARTLHRIAGSLHRYDERACSEDLACPKCRGAGIYDPDHGTAVNIGQACTACAGTGATVGRRVANLEAKASAIATAYGFRAYFQGDCRGCPLYLIPTTAPEAEDESHYSSRGHAVQWLG